MLGSLGLGSSALVDAIGSAGAAIGLFGAARLGRAVTGAVKDYQEDQEKVERERHTVDSFLLGVDADADHAAIPGFIAEWPKFKAEHAEVVRLVRKELGNGGSSTADQVKVLTESVNDLKTQMGLVIGMLKAMVEGRANGPR